MSLANALGRLKRSLVASSGTIVFGMEDGTVSIFGLVFGVAATTTSSAAVLVAGASGAAAAAVSMMAGAYLDAETNRDALVASRNLPAADFAQDPVAVAGLLTKQLGEAGVTPGLVTALTGAVAANPDACRGLLMALQGPAPEAVVPPGQQALWMLLADFLSAAIPIVPFAVLPVPQARIVSAAVTIALLVLLGIGRARIGGRRVGRTVLETVSIGVAAAMAGVAIGLLMDRAYGA
jgi:vacuolar iron transporter family protein